MHRGSDKKQQILKNINKFSVTFIFQPYSHYFYHNIIIVLLNVQKLPFVEVE